MWNEIRTEEDIETLMVKCAGFHDSCIVSVNYSSGAMVDENGGMTDGTPYEHSVEMLLQSQWAGTIRLRFTGVRKCSIVGWQDNYFCDIFGAYVGFCTDLLGRTRDDRLIVWADHGGFNPMKYSEEKLISPSGTNCTYIVAQSLSWTINEE